MGKYSKRKGYRGEYQLIKKLRGFKIDAVRVPVSGAVPGFKHDIYLNADRQYTGEVKVSLKRTKVGWKHFRLYSRTPGLRKHYQYIRIL